MRWDYRIITIPREGGFLATGQANTEKGEQTLNALGAEGWELVSTTGTHVSGSLVELVCVLKRPQG